MGPALAGRPAPAVLAGPLQRLAPHGVRRYHAGRLILPNWWDLAAIAAFSLVIYYWAVHSTLPHQRVSAAVEQVETEASVELEKSLV